MKTLFNTVKPTLSHDEIHELADKHQNAMLVTWFAIRRDVIASGGNPKDDTVEIVTKILQRRLLEEL